MKGKIVVKEEPDEKGNTQFGVTIYGAETEIPAVAEEVLMCGLGDKSEVSIVTDRETGEAHIIHPPKKIGGGVERG